MEVLKLMEEEIKEKIEKFQRRGSNWQFEEVISLSLHTVGYLPIKGKTWMPLAETIKKKKAVINMKNKDNQCFKWCVTRALNPVQDNPERVTRNLRTQSEELNWEGIEFPVRFKQIDKFETNNPDISVNVFYYDLGVYPLRIPKEEKRTQIDLLIISPSYGGIKSEEQEGKEADENQRENDSPNITHLSIT